MIGSPGTGLSKGGAVLPVKLVPARLLSERVEPIRRSGSATTVVANKLATVNFRARRFTMFYQKVVETG